MFSNETEIVLALQNGDEKAMETLFRTYYQRLCNYANTILNDLDESEEVVQQMFVQLWEKREKMEITSSVQSYLFRSVRNTCLNKIKHSKVRQMHAEEVTALAQQSEPATETTFHNELQSQIQVAIESLPEQCRLVFKLSRFEELKYSEIAEQLGISVKTVENHMGKALKIMRERLKDYLVVWLLFVSLYIC
ncbi:MAG: RNA polymerase sigma-70 factor [Bacteroidetes bacterium]|nr:RNA polymerase sigma-70 factor [Bacteroidota bacterium]MBP6428634.1 RNA polymerase sigma-70 factor [Bacteroidia bacterium]MBK8364940.1 RNA polymerase sigma-70 factor [Bacteroidota bacterium]MBK9414308.1 RNA polymerase sigma-70 factor [Bacteroidota bacterium]MBL0030864.1 RNA polymerase sigma-70 factor [Bacteroidota bacterium]